MQVVEVQPRDTAGGIGKQGPVSDDHKILTHVPGREKFIYCLLLIRQENKKINNVTRQFLLGTLYQDFILFDQ